MRIGTLLGIAVGVAACAEPPSAVTPRAIDLTPALSAEVSSTDVTRPFSANLWVSCANDGQGESVRLSGEIVIQTHLTEDAGGGTHFVTHVRPSGVVGVGQVSGLSYRGTGGTFQHEGSVPSGDSEIYTYVNNFRVIGQGPGNNVMVHLVVHQSWASGALSADVDVSSHQCK